MRTVATRYQGRIHAYEIWNEPNVKKILDGQHRSACHLTREASLIIHKVDPQAIVGFSASDWLSRNQMAAGVSK